MEGFCKEFYLNGNLKTTGTYKNGKLDGDDVCIFHEKHNKALSYKGSYRNGMKEGNGELCGACQN